MRPRPEKNRALLVGCCVSVQNLLDEYYIDYNTDTQQPTNNARFFSGRGRTFTLGWDYRF